jgi:hypothetical protein
MKNLLLSCVLAATVYAVEIDGDYENVGTAVSAAAPAAPDTISFQGLLELNFDHALNRAQHSDTRRVTIRETATHFKIQCFDANDKVTWTGSWERGVGCTVTDRQADLTFHNARLKYDSYVFSLQPVPQRDLLLVEVKRINATPLGPSAQPEGTFLFGRIARE